VEVEIVVAFVSPDLSPVMFKRPRHATYLLSVYGSSAVTDHTCPHGVTGLLVDGVAYRWQQSAIQSCDVWPM
jgi:hypothetical protein